MIDYKKELIKMIKNIDNGGTLEFLYNVMKSYLKNRNI